MARNDQSRGDQSRAVTPDTAPEAPLWAFGEGTTRTDPLPAELDSLKEWGEYATDPGVRPVAYAFDLNGDGAPDWLVRSAKGLCGRAGCPTKLFTRARNGGYRDILDGMANDVYVTNRKVGGWPVLWIFNGGAEGGLSRLEYRDTVYVAAGNFFRNRERTEWTSEQYDRDTIWKKMEATPYRSP